MFLRRSRSGRALESSKDRIDAPPESSGKGKEKRSKDDTAAPSSSSSSAPSQPASSSTSKKGEGKESKSNSGGVEGGGGGVRHRSSSKEKRKEKEKEREKKKSPRRVHMKVSMGLAAAAAGGGGTTVKRPEDMFSTLDGQFKEGLDDDEKRNDEKLQELGVEQLNLRQFNCLRESVSLRLSRLGAPRRRPLNEVPVRRSNRVNTDPDLLMRGMDNSDSGRERSLSMESLSSDSEGGSQINGMSGSGSGSGIGVEVERGPVGGALVVPRIGSFSRGTSPKEGKGTPRGGCSRESLLSGSPRSGNSPVDTNRQLASGMTFLSPRLSMMIGAEGAGPYDQPPLTGRKKNKKERWAQEREDSFTNPDSTGDESMGGASVNDEARETDLLRLMVKAWEFKMISLALKNKEKALDLTNMYLDTLPPTLCAAPTKHLRVLNISNNRLTEIPRAISQLQSLRELNLSLNYISALPDELFQLTQLSVLDVSSNKLLSIPSHVSRLVSLEDLLLSYNELVELPAEICSLSSLMGLSLHHNALDHRSFPSDLSQLTNLLALDLSYNLFGEIPPQICFLSSLQELVFSYNKLTYVREEKLPLSKLSSLLLLDLSHNQLTKFGPVASIQICSLRELVVLSLNNNKLTLLPPGLWRLKNLRSLNIAGNPDLLTRIPDDIMKAGTKEILKFLHQTESDKKAAAEAQKKQQLEVSRDIGQFLALPGNTSPRGEKKTAGAKWRERIMQLRKNDGKIDKAKLRSGSMPNIRKGKDDLDVRNSDPTANVFDVISLSYSTKKLSIHQSSGMYSNITLSSSSTNSLSSTVSRSLLELTNVDMTASYDVNAMILPCADWYIEAEGIEEGRDGIDDYCVDLAEVPGVLLESPRFFPPSKRRSINPRACMAASEMSLTSNDSTAPDEYEEMYDLERESNYTPLYKKYFYKKAHVNMIGADPTLGPIVVSITKEKDSLSHAHWFLIRSQYGSLLGAIGDPSGRVSRIAHYPTTSGLLQGVKKTTHPHLQNAELHQLKSAKAAKQLKDLEMGMMVCAHKFGVIYCKDGQISEDEMLNNEEGSPAFEEFLACLGDKIRLKGWHGYRGGLDTDNDRMGKYSLYRYWRGLEMMFHVSTLLPYRSKDKQQVQRKQHIGNDVVVIIFVDGKTPFSPISFTSQFNKVFVVVQKDDSSEDDVTRYRVAVTASQPVPLFGPRLPTETPVFEKGRDFTEFLYTKLVNAERAAYQTYPLSERIIRTRCSLLTELIQQSLPPKWKSVGLLARRQKDLKSRSASNPDIPVLLTKDRSGSVGGFFTGGGKERCESFDNNYNHHLSQFPSGASSSSSSSPSSSAPSSAGSSYAAITPRLVRRRSGSAESSTGGGKQAVSKERSASTDSATKPTPRGGGRKGSMDAATSSLSSFVSGGASSLSAISEEADVSAVNTPRAGRTGSSSAAADDEQDGGKATNKKEKRKDKKERKKDKKDQKEKKQKGAKRVHSTLASV